MECYEKKILLEYLCNIFEQRNFLLRSSSDALLWLREYLERIMPLTRATEKAFDLFSEAVEQEDIRFNQKEKNINEARLEVLIVLRRTQQKFKKVRPNRVARGIEILGGMVGLADMELKIFTVISYYSMLKTFEDFFDAFKSGHDVNSVIAAITGFSVEDICQCFHGRSRLFTSGLLKSRKAFTVSSINYELTDFVLAGIEQGASNVSELRKAILGLPSQTELNWTDYDHLGESIDELSSFLNRAIKEKWSGVNVLLYGPPGTGKTEFSKVMAKKLGVSLYSVGEVDDDGSELSRTERVEHHLLASTFLANQKNSMLLFDEMDDLFDSSSLISLLLGAKVKSTSKVFLNRMLENNSVPTVWTINDPKILDECIIRRMAFAVEMKAPPLSARSKIWERMLNKHQVELAHNEILEFAMNDAVSPAIAENAIKFAKLTGGSAKNIQTVTKSLVAAMGGSNQMLLQGSRDSFHQELVNADMDLTSLVQGLTNSEKKKGFSLCLYGPSGTGKSAFARYLAAELEMEVLFCNASDILSAYVGQSEQNIARVFKQSIREEKILILDEADSLLRDRQQAHRSWEVTQVNELLTWMENHPLPFVCTTNLMNTLDQASLRRFTFKSELRYLNKEQQRQAFKYFFDVNPPLMLEDLSNLTPGDFAVVKKKAGILNQLNDPEMIVNYLADEVVARQPTVKMIGFNQ